ncbi:uncharacterized protein CDV56_101219 [Aspergillus thermomutatus]|uniref:Uncharacterized protein n=1 Tax=Aspergillus thermomutatus TaxID=41047 RepID=A0A397HT59_ASPTH|nr:uncharacterized protein CDV56_101219 [Aspergillus thermomutatus]RHZ65158.1 hypothetical protein CDV56_101219 [Aspergillus thermomutatus]
MSPSITHHHITPAITPEPTNNLFSLTHRTIAITGSGCHVTDEKARRTIPYFRKTRGGGDGDARSLLG